MNKLINSIIIALGTIGLSFNDSSAVVCNTTQSIVVRSTISPQAKRKYRKIKQSKKTKSNIGIVKNKVVRNVKVESKTTIEPETNSNEVNSNEESLKNILNTPEAIKLMDDLNEENAIKFLSLLNSLKENSSSSEENNSEENEQSNNSSSTEADDSYVDENKYTSEEDELSEENKYTSDENELSDDDSSVLLDMIEQQTANRVKETKTNKISSKTSLKTKVAITGLALVTAAATALWKSNVITTDTLNDPELLKENLTLLKNEFISKAVDGKNYLVEIGKSSKNYLVEIGKSSRDIIKRNNFESFSKKLLSQLPNISNGTNVIQD